MNFHGSCQRGPALRHDENTPTMNIKLKLTSELKLIPYLVAAALTASFASGFAAEARNLATASAAEPGNAGFSQQHYFARQSAARDPFQPAHKLLGIPHDSGFPEGHDPYNGMGCASDGKIYYVLSADKYDIGARMFYFDPKKNQIKFVGDLTEACGEKDKKSIVQGKSHVNFVEAGGKLFFATHLGFYSTVDGMEKMGIPPPGWSPYPGGHLLSYGLQTGTFEDYGLAPDHEGILAFNMDTNRARAFGLTWPSGVFFRFDHAKRDLKSFGRTCAFGEAGQGANYRTVCRSIAVNPKDGSAWYSTSEGDLFHYRAESDSVEPVIGDNLRKDYFGIYDPASPGHMGYNWRQTLFRASDQMIYGVHGNSGYLFRFDPQREQIEVLERLTSKLSKASGMFDQFSYGYLGFGLAPDGKTIFYLSNRRTHLRKRAPPCGQSCHRHG
ncbi:hypothetical protein SBV1_350031 [Verrucomicrobia bacterium]|nr:hypothetical protein SBV1_350031 [Verrucomicrobiota bacterium]